MRNGAQSARFHAVCDANSESVTNSRTLVPRPDKFSCGIDHWSERLGLSKVAVRACVTIPFPVYGRDLATRLECVMHHQYQFIGSPGYNPNLFFSSWSLKMYHPACRMRLHDRLQPEMIAAAVREKKLCGQFSALFCDWLHMLQGVHGAGE